MGNCNNLCQNKLNFSEVNLSHTQSLTINRLDENKNIPNKKIIKVLPNLLTVQSSSTLENCKKFPYNSYGKVIDDFDQTKNLPFYGPIKIQDGVYYTGQFKNKLRHGQGRQIWEDGTVYEGFWVEDQISTKGRLVHSDGDMYEGDWVNGMAEGIGIYRHKDGLVYTGAWRQDKQEGDGREEWADGTYYIGKFENGEKHGQGLFKWKDGSVFSGEFQRGKIEGMGAYKWPDKREYQGQWKNNMKDGIGQQKWEDGRVYFGEFKRDMRHGHGVYKWDDGQKYDGGFYKNKIHGEGQLTTTSGRKLQGVWLHGKDLYIYNQNKESQSPVNSVKIQLTNRDHKINHFLHNQQPSLEELESDSLSHIQTIKSNISVNKISCKIQSLLSIDSKLEEDLNTLKSK